jgi:hypothetical protein
MGKLYILEESANRKKKYTAIRLNPTLKRIPFGAKGYEDYTMHKDIERKKAYIERHRSTEDWNDTDSAGAFSRWLLWNKPTLDESIKDMEKRFNIKIIKAF